MDKKELMMQLLDLYEQRDAMFMPCTEIIVSGYIRKLELMLKELL